MKGKNEHVCWCVLTFFKLNERNFWQPSRQKFLSVKIFFQVPWKPFKSVKIYNTQTENCRHTCFNRNVLWFNLILKVKLMQIKNLSICLSWQAYRIYAVGRDSVIWQENLAYWRIAIGQSGKCPSGKGYSGICPREIVQLGNHPVIKRFNCLPKYFFICTSLFINVQKVFPFSFLEIEKSIYFFIYKTSCFFIRLKKPIP